jgi:hypothetical protein
MSDREGTLLRVLLRRDASAPALARRALAELEVLGQARRDAQLLASELVTSAVLRRGSDGDESLELAADLVPSGLRIAVTDRADAAGLAIPHAAERPGPSGIGLRMLQSLAGRWGAERGGGIRIWAEIALP